MANPVLRILDWLREGYPEGVPEKDYIPLLALLRRQLTDDEVREIAKSVTRSNGDGPVSEVDIGTLITKVTNELPHPDDVARVTSRLVAGGWPLADPRND